MPLNVRVLRTLKKAHDATVDLFRMQSALLQETETEAPAYEEMLGLRQKLTDCLRLYPCS
jgi:hypothetical protein